MSDSALLFFTVRQVMPPFGRWIGLTIVAGAFLAILGPFGSYMNGSPTQLLGYWIGAMLLGLMLYGLAYRLVDIWAPPGSRRWWLALLVAALLASIPETLATRGAAFRLWPELAGIRHCQVVEGRPCERRSGQIKRPAHWSCLPRG
jgi:uncharacterized BrkB/YihY/UPF0761 family membrane protein